jgi:hypothetical protein
MPFKSQKQRAWAHAAAKRGNKGAKKMVAHDTGGKLPKKVKRTRRGKR